MALMSCRECGKEVSTKAKACPHCGCTKKRSSLWLGVGIGILGMMLSFAIVTVALQTNEDKAILQAQEMVRTSLKDPSTAIFRDVAFHKEKQDGPYTSGYVCGFINGKNSFGVMAGERRFVARAFFGKNVLDVTNMQIEPSTLEHEGAAILVFDAAYWRPSCGGA
ncbi:zinc ribbon domain-containing protein [Chromobacterium phragmitis]|uniref:zinc ribbon domain-containing protein n=1 Tax=Chromobacterium amazonense TaxID=1382803 RepID=UPI0021B70595|nr:zinc ribbon domain-containing protein [Chromobacterium amazonense]MBM2883944.1 zinc ribbon domain-containing protein [Chromobacterium amazonense]MDE1711862.1 zinc ribbon domain-containing protein [Chromobacterium amazonense]